MMTSTQTLYTRVGARVGEKTLEGKALEGRVLGAKAFLRNLLASTVLACLVVLLLPSALLAAGDVGSAIFERSPYVGLDLGQTNFKTKGFEKDSGSLSHKLDETSEAWRFLTGYQITPGFSVEAFYTNLGKVDYSEGDTLGVLSAKATVKTYGVGGKFQRHIANNFHLIGGGGIHFWRIKPNFKGTIAYASPAALALAKSLIKKSGTNPYLELGLKKVLTDRLSLVGSYNYYKVGKHKAHMMTVGLRMLLKPIWR